MKVRSIQFWSITQPGKSAEEEEEDDVHVESFDAFLMRRESKQ